MTEYNIHYSLAGDDLPTQAELKIRHEIQDVIISNKDYIFSGAGGGWGGADIQFFTDENPTKFIKETMIKFGIFKYELDQLPSYEE